MFTLWSKQCGQSAQSFDIVDMLINYFAIYLCAHSLFRCTHALAAVS